MRFPNDTFKLKKDRYVKVRDGETKLLFITCSNCDEPVMIYQKDGRGNLLRCYEDRIHWAASRIDGSIICGSCDNVLANPMIYAPEKRMAYRLIPGKLHIYRSLEQAENKAS